MNDFSYKNDSTEINFSKCSDGDIYVEIVPDKYPWDCQCIGLTKEAAADLRDYLIEVLMEDE